MSNSWPLIRLGDLLHKSNATIPIHSDKAYMQVTVRLWGLGVTPRNVVQGVEIAAPFRYVVRPNQFVVSRIDARNGAFGLVPDDMGGAVVSNDFPVFDVNGQRLLPAFLNWMSKTSDFVEMCKAASEGTTNRVRLKEERFLDNRIPLPPLSEQQRIVGRIEELAGKIERARELRRQTVVGNKLLLTTARAGVFDDMLASTTSRTLNQVAYVNMGYTSLLASLTAKMRRMCHYSMAQQSLGCAILWQFNGRTHQQKCASPAIFYCVFVVQQLAK